MFKRAGSFQMQFRVGRLFILLLTPCLLSLHAAAQPVSFSGSVGGETRTANVEAVDLGGRLYVPLAPLAEAFGGIAQVVGDQAQLDLDGKTATIRVNAQRVNTSTSQFTLGNPLLVSQEAAWIAPEDVTALFTNAFGIPVRQATAPAAAPATPELIEVEPLLPLEPLVPLPQETPEIPAEPEAPPLEDPLTDTPPIEPLTSAPSTAELLRPVMRANTIILDPGHGGSDPGIVGVSGLAENQLVLSVAELLQNQLTGAGFQVVLTRTEEAQDLNMKRRVEFANAQNGELFISLHAGASPSPRPHGVNVFYPYGPDGPGVASLTRTRSVLGEPIKNSAGESKVVAEAIAGAFSESSDIELGTVRQLPLRMAGGLNMPCVLVELGHLTNNTEEGLLRGQDYQQKVASAIASGITRVYQRPAAGGGDQ